MCFDLDLRQDARLLWVETVESASHLTYICIIGQQKDRQLLPTRERGRIWSVNSSHMPS